MLKGFLWNAFENTGSIDAYLSYKQLESLGVKEEKKDNIPENVISEDQKI